MWLCSLRMIEKRRRRLSKLIAFLDSVRDPVPLASEFIRGVEHWNDQEANEGEAWDVARAIASRNIFVPRRAEAGSEGHALGVRVVILHSLPALATCLRR